MAIKFWMFYNKKKVMSFFPLSWFIISGPYLPLANSWCHFSLSLKVIMSQAQTRTMGIEHSPGKCLLKRTVLFLQCRFSLSVIFLFNVMNGHHTYSQHDFCFHSKFAKYLFIYSILNLFSYRIHITFSPETEATQTYSYSEYQHFMRD